MQLKFKTVQTLSQIWSTLTKLGEKERIKGLITSLKGMRMIIIWNFILLYGSIADLQQGPNPNTGIGDQEKKTMLEKKAAEKLERKKEKEKGKRE